jgi:predicted ATPase/DNA-binding CsgD family transcriptional regulator
VGRAAELRRLRGQAFSARLRTLVGPGGVGKTRLALQLAANGSSGFGDQMWLVELAALSDGRLVSQAVADVLGIRQRGEESWEQTLVAALRTRRLVLLMDGCEHLLAACARLVELVLRTCPGVHVLATSREPLGVEGEVVWRVAPLSLPAVADSGDPRRARASEAVRLFVARAGSQQAPFRLTAANSDRVVEICRRLGGLPLAIELVAARVPGLGVKQVAARLTSHAALDLQGGAAAPARQQSLRATLDWSHALLTSREQVLLRRLAVFVGGWTLDAAEAVCSDRHLPRSSIADVLDRLINKSFVVLASAAPTHRYQLPTLTRQYALEQLAASGELNEMSLRHAEVMLRLAELVPPERLDVAHAATLEQEQANLTAALRWAITSGTADLATRLAVALYTMWYFEGRCAQGATWLRRCLELPSTGNVERTRALAGCLAGYLTLLSGNLPAAQALVADALDTMRAVGDDDGVGEARHILATIALWRGDLVSARQWSGMWRTADAVASGSNELAAHLAFSRLTLAAVLHWESGDQKRARAYAAQALQLAQRRDDAVWRGRSLYVQALTLNAARDPALALRLAREAVAAQRANNDLVPLTDSLCLLGHRLLDSGDHQAGLATFLEAVDLTQRTRQRVKLPRLLAGAARALAPEHPDFAVHLAAASHALGTAFECSQWPSDARRDARWLVSARHVLGGADFAAAWAAGLSTADRHAVPSMEVAAATKASLTGKPGPLTRREGQVAGMLAGGLSNRRIARELSLSVATVRTHVEHILAKLGMNSRAQVAAWALRQPTPAQAFVAG